MLSIGETINCCVDFLNDNESALMIIITSIYVIATIIICFYNGRSAKATREQVAESQRQFEETKRLERMPYFDVTVFEKTDDYDIFNPDFMLSLAENQSEESIFYPVLLQFTNIGSGTATNVTYTRDNTAGIPAEHFPFSTLGRDRSQVLCCHFFLSLRIDFSAFSSEVPLFLKYQDLLGNCYQQEVAFSFSVLSEDSLELNGIQVSVPQFVNNI